MVEIEEFAIFAFADVSTSLVNDESTCNEQARKQLLRLTRYWPSKLNEAFIYNIPKVMSYCFWIISDNSSSYS